MACRFSPALILAVLILLPVPGSAQEDALPYDAELIRLSEILGAVHSLHRLCNPDETSPWRARMDALLVAENPQPERKRRIAASFNRAYRRFGETYRTCTDSARFAQTRYLREGQRVINELTTRYAR